ncbi:MAG: class I SAM-dependent methyltransferase [Polyangiaceae bacterium]|nr:class I SAM-dependent methyltransferase [Polyangiaceae bacterium]
MATEVELEALYSSAYDGFRDDALFERGVRSLFAEHILPRAKESCTLLDVGCGNGTVLRVASSLGIAARGIDFSHAAVELCVSRGLDAEVLNFATHDFETQFDFVTFWDVLEHLVAPSDFIRSAARALKPGGWLVVKVPHHRTLSVAIAAAVPRLAPALLSTPAHLQFFTEASLERLLQPHFEAIQWVPLQRGMRTQTAAHSLRKRVARGVVDAVLSASGDGNLLAIARRKRDAETRS